MNFRNVLTMVAIFACLPSAKAGFLIQVRGNDLMAQPPTFVAGETGELVVSVFSTETSGPRTTSGYNLGFDFDTDGVGFGSEFSNFSAAFNPVFGAASGFTVSAPAALNYDFEASTAGNTEVNLQDFTGPTDAFELFRLTFDIAANAAPGLYDFQFQDPALQSNILLGDVDINTFVGVGVGPNTGVDYVQLGGQFQIVAVPEPTSLLALSAVSVVGLALRRRRR